ncbi:MAG: leucine-rich repeat domain-containing protein [Treponema sp.]|jgi:hypothetical protein|nr:leucine-rich repeat domain-containing protein [Treponema sp.]
MKNALLYKIAPLFAVLVITACDFFEMPVPAADNVFSISGMNFFYEVTSSSAITITDYSGRSDVTIPSEIKGMPVTTIGSEAFSSNQLTNVTMPDSVVSIGNFAFYSNKLTGVTIPDGVVSIGTMAFARNKLICIDIPNSVTHIGNNAFTGNELTGFTIPDRFISSGFLLFSENKLTGVTIPDGVTPIGYGMFLGNQLTSITIEANVTLYDDTFGNGFEAAYNNGGKLAGTYTRPNTDSTTWERQ